MVESLQGMCVFIENFIQYIAYVFFLKSHNTALAYIIINNY